MVELFFGVNAHEYRVTVVVERREDGLPGVDQEVVNRGPLVIEDYCFEHFGEEICTTYVLTL